MNPYRDTGCLFLYYSGVVIVGMMLYASPAAAIYINPLHPDGAGLARNIADAVHPAVGIVRDSTNGDNCSGSLIESPILPSHSFVLTAGHCVTNGGAIFANGNMGFRVSGSSDITPETSDRIRRHSKYNTDADLANDLGLFRLTKKVATVPLTLRRNAVNAGNAFEEVGFGDPGFPNKREASFTVNNLIGAPNNRIRALTDGNGTNANPTRHSCGGDSGGPYLFGDEIGGVHSDGKDAGGNAGVCDGSQTQQLAANVPLPFLHNWIDSYTQKAIFWDNLNVGPETDSFEVSAANYGLTGLPIFSGWSRYSNYRPQCQADRSCSIQRIGIQPPSLHYTKPYQAGFARFHLSSVQLQTSPFSSRPLHRAREYLRGHLDQLVHRIRARGVHLGHREVRGKPGR